MLLCLCLLAMAQDAMPSSLQDTFMLVQFIQKWFDNVQYPHLLEKVASLELANLSTGKLQYLA